MFQWSDIMNLNVPCTRLQVAIKIIDKNRARKDRYVSKNMRREARLLQMIRHPHIVQLLEIVETSQSYYLVFEFADGGDLMDHICKRKKLEEDEVRKFIRQIISAVEYLHRLGIMHRDLKVENLLLDANKNIKIIDFGLSNTIYATDHNNENHCTTQCGSPAYAAPELLVRKDYGPQIDVWSIGVNLYAMLTGRLPYTVEPFNISTLYNKMLKRQMNVIPEHLSDGCKDMISKLLNPDPKERLHILEAVRHRWITMDERDPLVLLTCPNYLCEEDLDDRILDHVEEKLKLNSDDVIRDVIQNKATKNSCVYHLLVRRLQRYEREQRKLMAASPAPTIKITEPISPPSTEHTPTPTKHQPTTQKNGLVKRSTPKTHIMENPFKTIKVALIRQKKAAKNEEKSKRGKTPNPEPHSATTGEPAHKPKLCAVKRVALVKFSPVRRSLRGLTSCSRNSTNSPRPGRRKAGFEGLQQRRKSPKVRRRHAEPDDGFSSTASIPKRRSIDSSANAAANTERMRIDDQNNNNTLPNSQNSKTSVGEGKLTLENSDLKSVNFASSNTLENISEDGIAVRDKDPVPETITHLYTDRGVVLKRDTSSERNGTVDYEREQACMQHHVFKDSSVGKGNTEDFRDKQVNRGIDGVKSKQGTIESWLSEVEVVNSKISSIPVKSAETVKSPNKCPSGSNTQVSSSLQTPRNNSQNTRACLPKHLERKLVTPRRSPYKLDNSSKIPVLSGKLSSNSRQTLLSQTRLAPRTSTANSRTPGTAARKNDVARLADKYDKCVSVMVVERSKDVGKKSAKDNQNSTAVVSGLRTDGKTLKLAGKCSANGGTTSSDAGKSSTDNKGSKSPGKGSVIVSKVPNAGKKSLPNNTENTTGAKDGSATNDKSSKATGKSSASEGKMSTVAGNKRTKEESNTKRKEVKGINNSGLNRNKWSEKVTGKTPNTVASQKGKSLEKKGRSVDANAKSLGCKEKTVKVVGNGNGTKEKNATENIEQTRNSPHQPKIQDQPDRKPSLVKSAKESLASNASRNSTKNSNNIVENTKKNSPNEQTTKVPTVEGPRLLRPSVKSQQTKDGKDWTGDERRMICNYRKTNEPSQTNAAVKCATKTATSVGTPGFRTS
ncbi:serine/threonine kinase SAD-1-like isoform X2 [Dendronephthya gigantea]|uniref:serine/threonine kinase SAD-1-like isoform X2 n=1 Tax=Dendronephthya gigantea TaxID=151771 RepID=UPI00106D9E91|nr:serine/threonine kinase SAD-1-like isoform X2 [Dendronephthya gigantea]